ncbi:hypothetical protein Tco_0860335 [Tanacetum coccineum]|uniref:Reverse transcriptase domain-containing protein n=1 Tax=Tanacetum coccineum TaxID=301880 RepID=A0ABQ5BIG2_9ASTR
MMQRVDDFVKSEEAYKSTELPKGEQPEMGHGTSFRGGRPPRSGQGNGHQKMDNYDRGDHYQSYVPPRAQDRRYCDYHSEKGHYTNDCYHLKKKLEASLESGKLNHLVKDVRRKGNNIGRHPRNNNGRGRVINMVQEIGDCRKQKSWRSQPEECMNVPITFPPVAAEDVSDDPLVIEAEAEGYWVRRVFVDQGAAIQVMFEHCFDNLSPAIKAQLTPTQTELVGFSGEVSSPYNIILGRTWMRELRVVSFTIYVMVKFLTSRGVATLIAQTAPIYECRWLEKRTGKHDEKIKVKELKEVEESREEKVLVNPTFPEQTITIGTQLSAECRERLINLLKNNMDVFEWQPSDMIEVPI